MTIGPFAVATEDPVWVEMADGVRLACTLWRPVCAAPVPVVVEAIPYRRRDGTVFRDVEMHPWLAAHGIACLRVDLRGAGDSGGDLWDEYLPQEQQDCAEVIAWAAAQPWANGRVGMTGISWGGFNALQVAALRPPALKAILTNCASDDRFADDVHYMGGALLTEDAMWSTFMLAKKALPPDPQIVGPNWRAIWARRLQANRSWSETWMAHQARDAYWRQGSVCEDYAAIEAPTMVVCGWEDSYTNAVLRLLSGLRCPRLGLIGPWTHTYPCRGSPGPNIGYLQEALRWWRHWLCDEPTGIMDEPMLRVWIGQWERPRPWYDTHAGSWAAEPVWPPVGATQRLLHLDGEGLADPPGAAAPSTIGAAAPRSVCSPATAGTDCGRWGGYGGQSPDMAIDQRAEDARALCYDLVLDHDLTVLGTPVLDLVVTVDQPRAHLVARLMEVAPYGASALVSWGVVNLAHLAGAGEPGPCAVGTPLPVRLRLNDLGRRFAAGHRLRLALSTQHWPILWPQPGLATVSVLRGTFSLPERAPRAEDAAVRFEPAVTAPPVPTVALAPASDRRTVTDDVGSGLRQIELFADHGRTLIADRQITVGGWNRDCFSIHPDDPLSARLVSEYVWSSTSGAAEVETHARTEMHATADAFVLSWRIEAREAGALVHSQAETRVIPRTGA